MYVCSSSHWFIYVSFSLTTDFPFGPISLALPLGASVFTHKSIHLIHNYLNLYLFVCLFFCFYLSVEYFICLNALSIDGLDIHKYYLLKYSFCFEIKTYHSLHQQQQQQRRKRMLKLISFMLSFLHSFSLSISLSSVFFIIIYFDRAFFVLFYFVSFRFTYRFVSVHFSVYPTCWVSCFMTVVRHFFSSSFEYKKKDSISNPFHFVTYNENELYW